MTWLEAIGYLASLLVFSTFYMKTMIPLRYVAISSNLAFITFGYFGRIYPVLILHLLLLPLNIMRLLQIRKLIQDIKNASDGGFSFESMVPFMTKQSFGAGQALFNKGDKANALYLLSKGSIRLPEIDVTVSEKGAMVGEIGLFTSDHTRTTSALCDSDVEVLMLTEDKALQLYYQDPKFGLYLVQMVVRRLIEDWSRSAGTRMTG